MPAILGSSPSLAGGDLLAHWRFDEPIGSVAHDETGAHDGLVSATGVTLGETGIAGSAVRFERAKNGFVEVAHLPELETNDFTAVVWMKTPPGDVTPTSIVLSQHEAWYEAGWLLSVNDVTMPVTSKATFTVNTGFQTVSSATSVTDGQWHQIAVTWGLDNQLSIFVDGAPAEASRVSAPIVHRDAPMVIGGVLGVDVAGVVQGYYNGWIDDLQLYRRRLSDSELDWLYRNPGQELAVLSQPILFTPQGGDFVGSLDVRLTSTVAGTVIRFTLDGTEPVTTSPAYLASISLHDTTTITARLFVNEFPASEIVSARFTKLPPIAFTPNGGLFTNSVQVTLRNNLGLGTIRYTMDGTDPAAASAPYTTPVTLTAQATLKACVFLNGFAVSEIRSANFSRVYALDDGIPAEWRQEYFGDGYLTDPSVAADADPDKDGWNNLLEYRNNTNPTDNQSHPVITAAIRAIPLVSWNSVPGLTYRLLRKSSVNAPNWEIVLSAFSATNTQASYVDSLAPTTAVYQVELVP